MVPLKWLIQPTYLDEARKFVQQPMFDEVQQGHPLKGRCLNAGSGEGLYAAYLASLEDVTTVVHIDMSAPVWAKGLGPSRHLPSRGSLTRLPFDAQVFDSCLCSEVIEHISDDGEAAAELARVLKPGGRL